MLEKTGTQRNSYHIQVLRGLAIIAVVLIHTAPKGIVLAFIRPFLNFAVGLFIFLSGMLSNAARWNPKKRILKVLIPYIIWTIVYALIADIRNHNLASYPRDLAIQLISGKAAAHMYFVFVYCELTLLIPLIDRLARSKYKYAGFLISPLEIFVFRLLPILTGVTFNRYFSVLISISCAGWFTYFYLGYLMGNGFIKVEIPNRKLVVYLIVSILLQIAEGCWYFSMGANNGGTQMKLSAVLTGSIFMILCYRFCYQETDTRLSLLKQLGDHSFAIYFSHIAVIQLLIVIPFYRSMAVFPLNGIITIAADLLFISAGRKILGKYAKYLAL